MKKLFITALFTAAVISASAQEYTRLSYPISWGANSTGEQIPGTSWVGLQFELGHEVHSNATVGFETGWVTLYDELKDVSATYGTTTVTGNQYRFLNTIPLLAKYTYYFDNSSSIVPFAAAAGGISWAKRTTDVGIYRFSEEEWPLTLSGELGISFEMDYSSSFTVSAYYQYLAERQDLAAQSFYGLRIGFLWK